jgi:hypothetical protein
VRPDVDPATAEALWRHTEGDPWRRYSSAVPNRFYRRRWGETRGDEFDGWGCSAWHFEVDHGGWPVRQIEVYDVGPVLRYGCGHDDDRYGGLSRASLYDSDEDWQPFEITTAEFELVWQLDGGS